LDSVLIGTIAVGALLAPPLIDAVGDRWALVATGLLLPALVAATRMRLARLDAAAVVPERRLALLRGLPLFAPLPAPTLEHLAATLAPATFAAGQVIFRQGEHGDRFYLLDEGEVDVAVDGRPANRLGPGEGFGEIALLRDTPRTATITARGAVRAFALERDEFLAAVTGDVASTAAADEIVAARLARARPAMAAA
ncbi:MAG TPA: cyclic nucleotide-binding domain-containing protein, partial [Solirubrobacteraceae bacterium]|nr:cyclic nucleotide-binding domain-containing protein [Solirubrobacteraceae bacterium]